MLSRKADGGLVPIGAEARHHAESNIGDEGTMAEGLAHMHVGDVHLDHGNLDAVDRVANRHEVWVKAPGFMTKMVDWACPTTEWIRSTIAPS